MRVLCAPNAFKGSLGSARAARAIEKGWRAALPDDKFDAAPIADGGDGTLDAVAACVECRSVRLTAPDPLGRPAASRYLVLKDGGGAVVEMALASGLAMLKLEERNAAAASSLGTGLLIRHALERGARTVYVGIGGSATNDGGAGIAAALGWRFLDGRGREVSPCGGNLGRVRRVDASGVMPELKGAKIIAVSDVASPLLGPCGASRMFSPQKGAGPREVERLEKGMGAFAEVVERQLGRKFAVRRGAGAAGGAGFGVMAFAGGRVTPGVEWIMRLARLEERIAAADLALTGEGFLDAQSLQGKAPLGVARAAKRHGVPVIAFCGGLSNDEKRIYRAGFDAVVPIVNRPMSLDEAMARAAELLESAAHRAARLYAAGRGLARATV